MVQYILISISFATEKIYALVYGIGGCVLMMSQSYFNGTLTTLEKRFKIPTKNSGIIIIAHDISLLIASLLAGYYVRRVHRPRWIGFGEFNEPTLLSLYFLLKTEFPNYYRLSHRNPICPADQFIAFHLWTRRGCTETYPGV